MSVETLIEDCEAALVRLIRLGLLWRYPEQASVAALGVLQTAVLRDGALCPVTGGGLFEWYPFDTTAPDGSTVVIPTTLPAGKTNGRWRKVSTAWTFGAGGESLASKATGYLRTVEAYSSDDGPDEILARVFGQTPSVLVQFTGDEPVPDSNLPGTFYKDPLEFQLLIVVANLRGKATATQGSPISGEDPGAYRIIGQLRRLLCGVSPDFGITGVERVEIGRSALELEDQDRRLFVWSMGVSMKTSFDIQDEDLVAARVRAQPALTEHYPAARFDKLNYVARGGGLDEGAGAGFSRNLEETIAVVGGVAVSSATQAIVLAADSDTYRDLDADGVWTLTTVTAEADAPVTASGSLRVGVTRTDGAGVVRDHALCSYSIPFGDPIDVGS